MALIQKTKGHFHGDKASDEVLGAQQRFLAFMEEAMQDKMHCCLIKRVGDKEYEATTVYHDATDLMAMRARGKDYKTPEDFMIFKDETKGMKETFCHYEGSQAAWDAMSEGVAKEKPYATFEAKDVDISVYPKGKFGFE